MWCRSVCAASTLEARSLTLPPVIHTAVTACFFGTILAISTRPVLLAFPFLVLQGLLWLLIVDDPVADRILAWRAVKSGTLWVSGPMPPLGST